MFFIILALLVYIELRLYLTKENPKFEGSIFEMAGAVRPFGWTNYSQMSAGSIYKKKFNQN